MRAIAFYLPQFHPIPENDEWWGKGFTEWTNVTKAVPQFVGHYQPKLPADLGFYDLRVPDVQEAQISLARQYGVHGFCFYYYWFGGKRLLETPIRQFLDHGDWNFPFCICWANENWTRRWDGQEDAILLHQEQSLESQHRFIQDVAPILRDPRYITVRGRPLLVVYRANILDSPRETAEDWKQFCRGRGLKEPFLVAAQTFGCTDPRPLGFDAAVEFPPHGLVVRDITHEVKLLNPAFSGRVYDYADVVEAAVEQASEPEYPLFRAVFPAWDNEPRTPGRGHVFAFSTPALYGRWLRHACLQAMQAENPDERLVFINAWNEWGEGAYLEPDRDHGHAYLEATAAALSSLSGKRGGASSGWHGAPRPSERGHDTAVVLHLYYEDLWPEIAEYLGAAGGEFDLFISAPRFGSGLEQSIKREYPNAQLIRCRNVGRDMAPFLATLPVLLALKYKYACKIHTKKTPQRSDGDAWRRDMIQKLLGSRQQVRAAQRALARKGVGLVAPSGHLLPSEYYWGAGEEGEMNRAAVRHLIAQTGLQGCSMLFPFAAGSMFWFRPEVLQRLALVDVSEVDFGPELGEADGTLAHGLERFVGCLVAAEGFSVMAIGPGGRVSRYRQGRPMVGYRYAVATENGVPYTPGRR